MLGDLGVLGHEVGGNTVLEWSTALVVLVGIWLVLTFARRLIRKRVGRPGVPSGARFDDIAVHVLAGTRHWFFAGVATVAASRLVDLPKPVIEALTMIFVFVVVVQSAVWATTATHHALEAWRQGEEGRGRRTTLATALGNIARGVIWTVALLVMLQNLGVEITALVAGLGVGGIAIGFALQNVMADLFAAMSIYTDRPFDVGDFIKIGDVLGTVEAIGWRSTRIASLSGERVVLFNDDVTSSRIQNFTVMRERRVVVELRVSYATPYEKIALVAPMLQEIIESVGETRFDRAHFKAYGEYALLFEAVYFVLSPEYATYMDRQQQINLAIHERFEKHGIAFAFPRRTVQLEREPSA